MAAWAPARSGIEVTLPAKVDGDLDLLGEKHGIGFDVTTPGLLRFDGDHATVPEEPARGIFVSAAIHPSTFETYPLIQFCLDEGVTTVFYRGSFPGERPSGVGPVVHDREAFLDLGE